MLLKAGQIWEDEVLKRHLAAADIILLLVTAALLASDYCYSSEAKYALQRHEAREAVVVPIILRPVDWSTAPSRCFTPYQPMGKLLRTGRIAIRLFLISQGIKRIIEQGRQGPAPDRWSL